MLTNFGNAFSPNYRDNRESIIKMINPDKLLFDTLKRSLRWW